MADLVVVQDDFIVPVEVVTAVQRYQAVREFISSVLREGIDYGKIPGFDRPTLLKPGAEKMCTFFKLRVMPALVAVEEDWSGMNHGGEPFFYYRYRVDLIRRGEIIAAAEGSANSWEKKYRYRQAERICPQCGKPAIIKGKVEYGGGWVCFAKKGGCGAKFKEADPAIVEQQVGQVPNPDPADLVNTLQKISQKRALVAAVLIATNTSDYFNQDAEDFQDEGPYHVGSLGKDSPDRSPVEGQYRAAVSPSPSSPPVPPSPPAPAPAPLPPPPAETGNSMKLFHAIGHFVYGDAWDEKRHLLCGEVTRGASTSSKNLTPQQLHVLCRGMVKKVLADMPEGEVKSLCLLVSGGHVGDVNSLTIPQMYGIIKELEMEQSGDEEIPVQPAQEAEKYLS